MHFEEPYGWGMLIGVVDWSIIGRDVLLSQLWAVGLLVGIAFPDQPRFSNLRGFCCSALAVAIGVSTQSPLLSRAFMLFNGAIFIQSLWYRWTSPGTFHRYIAAIASNLSGNVSNKESQMSRRCQAEGEAPAREKTWYIDEDDLEFFLSRVERCDAPVRASSWELLLEKQIPQTLQYRAYRRLLKDLKKTEYLSTSVTADTSPHEVMDFYLSDPVRQQWDGLLTKAEVMVDGDFKKRQQLVHWVRSFPFVFLSDRDYVIARQLFQVEGTLYGISKVVKYDSHCPGNTVRMENYWSMWSCKPVACPFGTGKMATETTLLHMEDFKIPENLGRFAVKAGMWGFVRKMTPHMKKFVSERRARGVNPQDCDPYAFGAPVADGMQAAHQAVPQHAGKRGSKLSKAACVVAAACLLLVLVAKRGRLPTQTVQQQGLAARVNRQAV